MIEPASRTATPPAAEKSARPGKAKPAGAAVTGARHDGKVAALLGLFAFAALYAPLALRLADSSAFFASFNLLFDLDPWGYGIVLTSPPGSFPGGHHGVIKHPLFQLYVVFGLPWVWAGVTSYAAAGLATAAAGGITVALFHATARRAGTPPIEAVLFTSLFMLSAGQIFAAFIVESYAFAALSLALMWFVTAGRLESPRRHRFAPPFVAALVFGTTVSNVVQAAIAEAVIRIFRQPFRAALKGMVLFGAAVAAVVTVCLAVFFPDAFAFVAENPADALRRVYWTQTKGAKTGMDDVLRTYFIYGYLAPEFTLVPLPDGIVMRDFRAFLYSPAAIGAAVLWPVLAAVAAALAIADQRSRPFALALCGAILFNIVLHLDFQYRGSLFLYTPHLWFAVVMLAAAGVGALTRWTQRRSVMVGLRTVLLALVLAAAAVNLPRAWEAASAFDAVAGQETNSPASIPVKVVLAQ